MYSNALLAESIAQKLGRDMIFVVCLGMEVNTEQKSGRLEFSLGKNDCLG